MNQVSLFREFSYDVTVVMVSYHTGPALWRTIESVLEQEGLNELIIVDNGNSDDTRQRLAHKTITQPRLKIVTGQGNVGLFSGYNLGAQKAKAKYLFFLSPEAVLPNDFLLRMVDSLQRHPECRVVSPMIIDTQGRERLESRRNPISLKTLLVEKLRLYHLPFQQWKRIILSHDKPPTEAITDLIPSRSAMMMEKSFFEQMQGFDETFFYDYGDMDFAIPLSDYGYKTLFQPELKIVDFRTTASSRNIRAAWHQTRDFIRLFNTQFKGAYFPGVLPLIFAFRWLKFAAECCFSQPYRTLSFNHGEKHAREQKAKFLRTYKQFAQSKEAAKGDMYDLSLRAPILLTGSHTPEGLCILRRLLAADLEVVALYHNDIIDFEHPKLTWLHVNLLDTTTKIKGQRVQTLMHADELPLLPEHLETFVKLGIDRAMCLSSAYVFRLMSSKKAEERAIATAYVDAERDISRMAPVLNLDYTILRAGPTYGMNMDDFITPIARFVSRFGFFLTHAPAQGLRQPIHCDDLAITALALLNNKETFRQAYNVCGSDTLPYEVIIQKTCTALGKKPRVLKIKFALLFSVLSSLFNLKLLQSRAFDRKSANIDIIFNCDVPVPPAYFRPFLHNGQEDIFPKLS